MDAWPPAKRFERPPHAHLVARLGLSGVRRPSLHGDLTGGQQGALAAGASAWPSSVSGVPVIQGPWAGLLLPSRGCCYFTCEKGKSWLRESKVRARALTPKNWMHKWSPSYLGILQPPTELCI